MRPPISTKLRPPPWEYVGTFQGWPIHLHAPYATVEFWIAAIGDDLTATGDSDGEAIVAAKERIIGLTTIRQDNEQQTREGHHG
jgi:hypothetical protein